MPANLKPISRKMLPFLKIKNYKYWVASQQAYYLMSRHDWGHLITQTSSRWYASINLFLYQPLIIALSQFSKALKCYLLVETIAVSIYLATEYLCICFSPFLRYVSLNLYSFILPFCLLVSIMLSSSSYVVYFR